MASTLARRCSGDRCSQQGSGERVTVSVVANWPGLIVLPRLRAEYSLVRSNQSPSSGSRGEVPGDSARALRASARPWRSLNALSQALQSVVALEQAPERGRHMRNSRGSAVPDGRGGSVAPIPSHVGGPRINLNVRRRSNRSWPTTQRCQKLRNHLSYPSVASSFDRSGLATRFTGRRICPILALRFTPVGVRPTSPPSTRWYNVFGPTTPPKPRGGGPSRETQTIASWVSAASPRGQRCIARPSSSTISPLTTGPAAS